MRAHIKYLLDLLAFEIFHRFATLQYLILEVAAGGAGLHGRGLDDLIGLFARQPLVSQRQEELLRKSQTSRAVDILSHVLSHDDETTNDAGELLKHIIDQQAAVGEYHALNGGMRDVALVPEGNVLERGHSVDAYDPRQPGDPLAGDRIFLVRHGGRALLALAERLFDLPDLCPLKIPDLGGELLKRSRHDGQRGEILGMAVPLQYLRRGRRRL